MKHNVIILYVLFCLGLEESIGQDTLEYYNRGVNAAMEQRYDEAIGFFTKSIEVYPNHPMIHNAWYNRGLAKAYKSDCESAIKDFDEAIRHKADYFLAINMRGVCKKRLTDYNGAIDDYSFIIRIDSNYTDALQNRAEAFRLNNQVDKACIDWRRASELGIIKSTHAVNKYCIKPGEEKFGVIYRLQKTSENPAYGFSKDHPVRVGSFTGGGPQSQEAYLRLLRDPRGNAIKFHRVGSCCHYETENGIMGLGALDIYEIMYLDSKGKKKQAKIYITFYDYEEPMNLYGFNTVKK